MDTTPSADPQDSQARRACDPDLQEDKDPLTHEVIGAAIEVHRPLGPGFIESFYESALAYEFELRGIPFIRQAPVLVLYKGRTIGRTRLDFIVREELILELKAVDDLAAIHTAQVLSYLRASGKRKALLLNFKEMRLRDGVKRILL